MDKYTIEVDGATVTVSATFGRVLDPRELARLFEELFQAVDDRGVQAIIREPSAPASASPPTLVSQGMLWHFLHEYGTDNQRKSPGTAINTMWRQIEYRGLLEQLQLTCPICFQRRGACPGEHDLDDERPLMMAWFSALSLGRPFKETYWGIDREALLKAGPVIESSRVSRVTKQTLLAFIGWLREQPA